MSDSRFAVGIIGLGPLGMAYATRLLAQGMPVIGYRRSGMEEFVAAGGIAATSPADLVDRAEVVLDCLPHEDALLTLFEGEFSIMDAVRSGQPIVTLANHSLAGKQRLADLVTERGGVVLDGSVSGTPAMANAGEAAIFLSGDADIAAGLDSLLGRLTRYYTHVGAFGEATRRMLEAEAPQT